ncbi:hypothetical protein HAX54_019535 [Datura stramonium]|uniref:Uncharacterized protein n=1 Tax=Datura stramonium TaxID=4076 RepID=A0ABS8UPG8_DATST|nr:hypothetical protein [Datura stramonium]
MAGGAAGGFITRALESMLKECSNKKCSALQIAIQSYIGSYLPLLYLISFEILFCATFLFMFDFLNLLHLNSEAIHPPSSDFLLSAFLLMPMPNKTVKKSAWDSVPRISASHVDLPFGQLDSVIFV